MLDYEKQILLELMEDDGLLVLAKGLGLERILTGLVSAYNSPDSLVLVIGASVLEAEWVAEQQQHLFESGGAGAAPLPPRCVTAEVPVPERGAVYLQGGVLFVTSRILVVDLLMNRVPAHLVTGIIVWQAHKILESCQEAFILRLYRQKNKTGFIKALSDNAVSFTHGFCHVSRVLRNLFVRRLFLYPRFHLSVGEGLAKRKPEVVELHLRLTPTMAVIQSSLLDLVTALLHELRLVNRGLLDEDWLTVDAALSPALDRAVALLQASGVSISTRSRHLLGDLRLLRTLNRCLCQYDCVTFYNLTSSLRTTERALQSAGWLLLPPAETLFINAKKRVFGDNPPSASVLQERATTGSTDGEDDPLGLTLEQNPKWECLMSVLEEVRSSARQCEGPLPERCLVLTADDATAQQLQQVLVEGPQRVLQRIFYQSVGPKLGLIPPAHLFEGPEEKRKKAEQKRKKKRRRVTRIGAVDGPEGSAVVDGTGALEKHFRKVDTEKKAEDGIDVRAVGPEESADLAAPTDEAESFPCTSASSNNEVSAPVEGCTASASDSGVLAPAVAGLDETITLTQIREKYRFVGDSSQSSSEGDGDEEAREKQRQEKRKRKEKEKKKYEEKKRRKNLFSSPLILVQSVKNYSDPFALPRTLREVQPRYIVMYDAHLAFIRHLEVWQAESASHQCLLYLLLYKGTTEEQLHLTHLKREKDAFHYLIKEKAVLVTPSHAEGRTGDHPDLQRGADKAEAEENTRRGGGAEDQEKEEAESRIIVDMREFRSELPSLIHRRGIEIEPVTIEVGDYVLSPDMCVERKSLPDLVGSLGNGRLYNQAVAMSRHYTTPLLLIEFDQNKPFHLQAGLLSQSRPVSTSALPGEPDTRDVCSRLQLLTLHCPRLRLLWCSSPYATAEMFQLLKAGKPEPDVATAQAAKSEACSMEDLETFNPMIHDFVSRLPGVTHKNISRLLNAVSDLPSLMALDKVQLTEVLGHSAHAAQLHGALHAHLTEEEVLEDGGRGGKGRGKTTRRGLPKFSK